MEAKHTPGAENAAKRILKLDSDSWDNAILADCLKNGDEGWTMEAIAAIVDQETGLPDLQAKIDRLEAEKAELLDACKKALLVRYQVDGKDWPKEVEAAIIKVEGKR